MIIHIKDGNQPIRELTIENANQELLEGKISTDAIAWRIGLENWVPILVLPDIQPSRQCSAIHVKDGYQAEKEMTLGQVNAELQAGKLSQDAIAWRDGLADWVPLLSLPEIQRPTPPPLPGKEPQPETAPSLPENLATPLQWKFRLQGKFGWIILLCFVALSFLVLAVLPFLSAKRPTSTSGTPKTPATSTGKLDVDESHLGEMNANGHDVAQEDKKSVEWFRKAAEQGDAEAQFNLGLMYENGNGVPKDDAKAVEWYRKAAEQSYAEAQNWLGLIYYNGNCGMPNPSSTVWRVTKSKDPLLMRVCGRAAASESKM